MTAKWRKRKRYAGPKIANSFLDQQASIASACVIGVKVVAGKHTKEKFMTNKRDIYKYTSKLAFGGKYDNIFVEHYDNKDANGNIKIGCSRFELGAKNKRTKLRHFNVAGQEIGYSERLRPHFSKIFWIKKWLHFDNDGKYLGYTSGAFGSGTHYDYAGAVIGRTKFAINSDKQILYSVQTHSSNTPLPIHFLAILAWRVVTL